MLNYYFLHSYLACSQKPWLNLPIDDRHFGYITKLTTKQNKTKHGQPSANPSAP
jgi:hypothetical protein